MFMLYTYEELISLSEEYFQKALDYFTKKENNLGNFCYSASKGFEKRAKSMTVLEALGL